MILIIGYALALVGLIAALVPPLMEWRARKRRKGREELARAHWYGEATEEAVKASLRAPVPCKPLPPAVGEWGARVD